LPAAAAAAAFAQFVILQKKVLYRMELLDLML
jgi:hypothetical protein